MISNNRSRLNAREHRPDYSLVVVSVVLMLLGLIGLIAIDSAVREQGITPQKQFLSMTVALVAFYITSKVDLSFWERTKKYIVYLAAAASTILALLPASYAIKGAKRWISFGPFSFQPSELIKFALLIYLASFLAQRIKYREINKIKETLGPISLLLGIIGLVVVVFQKDLGTMLVIAALVFVMLLVAEIPKQYMFRLGGGLIGLGALSIMIAPHRLERLTTFLNPGADLEGAGYHVNQALIAVGSGGIFGQSLGQSVQAYGYLPEAANDSTFAIFAEQFGFFGVVILLGIYAYLLIRILSIAQTAPNKFTQLLCVGVFAWIFSHLVLNIGAMLGIMPLTGITLPFLSYGGSSLLFMMATLGIVFNISRYASFERGSRANIHGRRRQRRTRYAS